MRRLPSFGLFVIIYLLTLRNLRIFTAKDAKNAKFFEISLTTLHFQSKQSFLNEKEKSFWTFLSERDLTASLIKLFFTLRHERPLR